MATLHITATVGNVSSITTTVNDTTLPSVPKRGALTSPREVAKPTNGGDVFGVRRPTQSYRR